MAGPNTRHNLIFIREDKFAKGISTKDSNIFIPSLTISQAQTLTSAQAPIYTQALASLQAFTLAPGPLDIYTNVNLQKVTKLPLESFVKDQKYGKVNFNLWDRAFNAKISDLYYNSSYMK